MSNALATIRSQIVAPGNARMLKEAAPKFMRDSDLAARVAYAIMYSMSKNDKLMACTPDSILNCAIDAVGLGLIPGGLMGHAYMVPFYDKDIGAYAAQLMPGYRGLISLALRGGVGQVEAHIVCEGDQFCVSQGTQPGIMHQPTYKERGEMYAVYSVATHPSGRTQFDVLSLKDVNHARQKSRAKSGPWDTDFNEMAKKTAVKRLCKYLPMSVDMARAIEIDARTDTGGGYPVLDAHLDAKALEAPKDAAQELADILPDVTPAAETEPPRGKQCPTCGEWFQRLGAHKCPRREPFIDAPVTDHVVEERNYRARLSDATAVHDMAVVDMCLQALGLPETTAEWTPEDFSLGAMGCGILSEASHPPGPGDLGEWCASVTAQMEA